MKLSAQTLYPSLSKKVLGQLKKDFEKTQQKWIVVSCSGTWYHSTEGEAQAHRAALKASNEFATIHHVSDIVF